MQNKNKNKSSLFEDLNSEREVTSKAMNVIKKIVANKYFMIFLAASFGISIITFFNALVNEFIACFIFYLGCYTAFYLYKIIKAARRFYLRINDERKETSKYR